MSVSVKVGSTSSATKSSTSTQASTKTVGTQTAAKSSESFSLTTSKISHNSPNINAKNLRDALDEVTNQIAKSNDAPYAPNEGDIWYDLDDDKFYVRDEDSWNEVVSSRSGTVDGGAY